MSDAFIHESSYVDEGAVIGDGTKIWHFCHVESGAVIGENCTIGQNAYIGKGVHIGDGCKIQNNVSLYSGVELGDQVFCGPSCVFTNDLTPRSAFPKGSDMWKNTIVGRGATIGANATIVCGHDIGAHAMVAAGAVVTKSVPDHALVMGVPAVNRAFVCRCGEVLSDDLACRNCGGAYRFEGDGLAPL